MGTVCSRREHKYIYPYDAIHKIYVATYTLNKKDISWKEVMDDLFEEKQWIFLSPMITQSVHLFYDHITCILIFIYIHIQLHYLRRMPIANGLDSFHYLRPAKEPTY